MEAYPLEEILKIKIKRMEDAEKVVQEKRRILEAEKEKLAERERERDRALAHHDSKLNQMRQAMDEGTTSDEIQMMKAYLNVCKENVQIEEKKVQEQQSQVELAAKNLEVAREEWLERRKDVDKYEEHKEEWTKIMRREEQLAEEAEQEEIGNTMFLSRFVQAKRESA